MSKHAFRVFRESHGYTQSEFGALLGLDGENVQARISHYETGRNPVPVAVANDFLSLARSHGEEHSLEVVYGLTAA